MTRPIGNRTDLGQRKLVYALVSAVLRYPEEALQQDLPAFHDAVDGLPTAVSGPLSRVLGYLSQGDLLELQQAYVAVFDLRRKCCLYLSYYLNGDTRRRGQALWEFQDTYGRAGFRVEGGELPDFLPAVLEFGAVGDEDIALELLQPHRGGLRLLRDALSEIESPYADAINALESVLPAPRAGVIANALLLRISGPPSELVGIDSHDGMGPFEPGIRTVGVNGGARQ